jgi:hypothetical protein
VHRLQGGANQRLPTTIPYSEVAMPRCLVIFHSRTGTCRKVAMRLADEREWAVGEIETVRSHPSYLRCIVQALLHLRPRVAYVGPDPAAFDLVVLVSPVWCGTVAAPMRSFLARTTTLPGPCAVLSVMGGRGAAGALRAVERLIHRPACATAALLQADVAANRHHAALGRFARRVASVLGPSVPEAAPRAALGRSVASHQA